MFCWKEMRALKGNGEIDPQPNEILFLLSDEDRLPVIDIHPFSKLKDRWRTERENFLYFAMMNCCCWWISLLQGNWWTGREQKEKMFLLCDDDVLLLMDVRPSNKLMDRWRTEVETYSTFGWWSVSVMRSHCEYAIQQSHHVCLFTYANCLLNTCAFRLKIYDLSLYLFK